MSDQGVSSSDPTRLLIFTTAQIAFPGVTYNQMLFNVDPHNELMAQLKIAKEHGHYIVLTGIRQDEAEIGPEPQTPDEKRYRAMQEKILAEEKWHDNASYNAGVLAKVTALVPLAGGAYQISFEPEARVNFHDIYNMGDYYEAVVSHRPFRNDLGVTGEIEALAEILRRETLQLVKTIHSYPFALKIQLEAELERANEELREPDPNTVEELKKLNESHPIRVVDHLERITSPEALTEFMIEVLSTGDIKKQLLWAPSGHRQELLEQDTVQGRLNKLRDIVTFNLQMRKGADHEISADVLRFRQKAAKKARVAQELTELMAVINENNYHDVLNAELERMPKKKGQEEDEELGGALGRLKAALKEKDLSPAMRQSVDDAFRVIQRNPYAPEVPKLEDFLKRICELPWGAQDSSPLKTDLAAAREILDAHHYGQYDAKDAILDFMASQIKSAQNNGKIACLLGPPGVGKTAMCEAIAEATGRQFVRIATGGIKDESTLRGHSRTYIDSKPGRIMKAMAEAGTSNPLILLDEIDKCSREISPVFLEILDPEQNDKFRDHYLGESYDLSNVLFMTSANDISSMDPALISRMQIINVPSYLPQEKLIIGRQYMLPACAREAGVHVEMSEAAMAEAIAHTQEAGVRKLKQTLDKLCSRVAREILEGRIADTTPDKPLKIETAQAVEAFLGKARMDRDEINETDEIGMVNGLGYTPAGGMLLKTQSISWNEEMGGRFVLTAAGNIKEVMKESSHAVEMFLRANAARLGLTEKMKNCHLHIFFPEVGLPKDGPSAGVTMSIAALSVLTERPIRRDIAMTGEVDIRGNVTVVGGIREKVMAAVDSGCKKVMIPHGNRHDYEDFPQDLKDYLKAKGVEIVPIKTVSEAMEHALVPKAEIVPSLTQCFPPMPQIPANGNRPDQARPGPVTQPLLNAPLPPSATGFEPG